MNERVKLHLSEDAIEASNARHRVSAVLLSYNSSGALVARA